MKIVHISDLHIGKRVHGFSMLEDQKYILNQIEEIIKSEQAYGVIIAGDIYDKPIPSEEAVVVLDNFISNLSQTAAKTVIISGNHDSAERIDFGSCFFEKSGVHICGAYDGTIKYADLQDGTETVRVHMLPFIKPSSVRCFYPEARIQSYSDAVAEALKHAEMLADNINILAAHQFVFGAQCCDSDSVTVGGLDSINVSVFEPFDYVALGHLHRPQTMKNCRYSGTPMKYSFSEANDRKSVTVLEVCGGSVNIKEVPLNPKSDLKCLKGTFEELADPEYYERLNREDYYCITLTDDLDVPDAQRRLSEIYYGLMKLDYDNARTRNQAEISVLEEECAQKSMPELFADFYRLQNGTDLTEEQLEFVHKLTEEAEAED